MTDSLTPQRVAPGRYQVQRTLGRGGMAVVSLAEDTLLGRQVALKTLQPAYAYDKAFVERFRREGQAGARPGHPHPARDGCTVMGNPATCSSPTRSPPTIGTLFPSMKMTPW